MSNLSITAWNYSSNNWSLCTYVGGITAVAGTAVQTIPLAWSVAPFPRVGSTGYPGKSVVSWTVNYGFSVLSSGTSSQTNWTAASLLPNQPLGTQVTISYDSITSSYNISPPTSGPAGILRFVLDKSIPPNPSPATTIGVSINGVPAAALPATYFQPNLTVDFQVNPTYSVCVAANFLTGDVITGSVMSTAYTVVFAGGATAQNVQLSPTNTWSSGGVPTSQASANNSIASLKTNTDGTYEVTFYKSHSDTTPDTPDVVPPPAPAGMVPFLFSDDLLSAIPISVAEMNFLNKNVPTALTFQPSGPAVNIAVNSQLQNIAGTGGDNRGSPWIAFWETNTGMSRSNPGCTVHDGNDTPNSYQGAHIFLSNQSPSQWYIGDLCAYHNNPARVGWQTAGVASMAVPISTYTATILTEYYRVRADRMKAGERDPIVKVSELFTVKELQDLRAGRQVY